MNKMNRIRPRWQTDEENKPLKTRVFMRKSNTKLIQRHKYLSKADEIKKYGFYIDKNGEKVYSD